MAKAMKAMKAAMKAMKARKAMKAMKAMKKKKAVSKIGRKFAVFRGSKAKTSGGLEKSALTKNKSGKVVSKKMSANSKKRYQGSAFQAWTKAVAKARKELRVTGFVAIGGKTATGKALYAKAKSFLA